MKEYQILLGNPETPVKTTEFDEQGRVVRTIDYTSEGHVNQDYVFLYDELGRLFQKRWNRGDNVKREYTQYFYDDTGRIVSTEWCNKPALLGVGYADGRPIIHSYYYRENRLIQKLADHREVGFYENWQFEYSDNGNLISEKGFNSSGELKEIYQYTYNVKNQLIKKLVSRSGRINDEISYEYDSNNLLIVERESTLLGRLKKYFYNDLGQISKIETYYLNGFDPTMPMVIDFRRE